MAVDLSSMSFGSMILVNDGKNSSGLVSTVIRLKHPYSNSIHLVSLLCHCEVQSLQSITFIQIYFETGNPLHYLFFSFFNINFKV